MTTPSDSNPRSSAGTDGKLGLGVIGLGEGRSIMSAALSSDYWNLIRVCDLDTQILRKRAAEFEFDACTTRFEELLDDKNIDVIAIYTPDSLHIDHCVAAMRAGKHVICTKPLITSLDRASELLSAAESSGKHLFVGQSSRFFEPMIHQRQDFESGKHGELLSVQSHYNHDHRDFMNKPWARSGGVNWIFGGLSHPVDLVRYYLPDIDEVMAYGLISPAGRELGQRQADTIHAIMKTRSGKIARVTGCYGSPHPCEEGQSLISCVLQGQRGASESCYQDLRYFTHFEGEGQAVHRYPEDHKYYFRFAARDHHAGEFQNYIDYFARCLRQGTIPKPDVREGIITVAVMCAIEQSIALGKPVRPAQLLVQAGLSSLVDSQ
ncbi:MAG: Gfo/Idh/MocA family oxidoreductase [Phycisphaerales bacterium]|nr:Gfo/Idh/MocA family oxidoreductase [Phycisphaerales bacterium]